MYRPNDYDLFLFFMLICKKHNIPYIVPDTYDINYLEDLFAQWHCKKDYRELKVPMYLKNNQAPTFAVPLVMRHRNCKCAEHEDKHMCMIIYIRDEKTLYFYDPAHNKRDYDISKLLDEVIVKFSLLGHPVNSVKTTGTECLQGAQECEIAISKRRLGETIGFCSIWSIHFLDHFFTGSKILKTKSLTLYIKDYLNGLLKSRRDFEHSLQKDIYQSFYLVKKRQMGEHLPEQNWPKIVWNMIQPFRKDSW